VATFVAGGAWYWVGVALALSVVAGVAGGTKRPAAAWTGGLSLLLSTLVHLGVLEAVVGTALTGLAVIGFLLVWTQGPAKPRRQPEPLGPLLLKRRVG
jgi:hypothetical protein